MDIDRKLDGIYQEIDNNTKDFTAVYNLDIENALENIKNKEFYTEDQARQIAQKWLRE